SNHPFTITYEAQTVWSDPPHWLADPRGVDSRVAGHDFDRVGARRSRGRSSRRTSYARTARTVSRKAWVGSSAILLWLPARRTRPETFPLVWTGQSLRRLLGRDPSRRSRQIVSYRSAGRQSNSRTISRHNRAGGCGDAHRYRDRDSVRCSRRKESRHASR